MKTQKTITINGNRYTAAELLKLEYYENNLGDRLVEIKEGELTFGVRENYIAIFNGGCIRRKDCSYGDTVAILVR
jgi:hypothetical protein